ncbi:MAG: DUF3558 domain-containing protein [Sciscionella sp.]|nr:DUF3558 domain-containing protein [Sciscionella sp.]
MRHRLFLTFGLFAVVGLLAGCSNQTGDNHQAGATTSGSSADSSGSGGPSAPKVAHPLDASKFIKNPCSSLTIAQATAAGGFDVGSVTAKRDDTAGQPSCNWQESDLISVVWWSTTRTACRMRMRNQSSDAYFTPLTIDGYPAVLADSTDERSQGTCLLVAGVSDQQVFSIHAESGPGVGAKSCTYAQNAAKAVIKNLGGNS